jgi:hypothetical protein
MPYLLDGNNLIGKVRRTARPSEQDRAALIAEVAERLRKTRAKATLFFDGPAGERGSTLGSLTVRVPASGSADDAILEAISVSRSPGECVVVTADRELARRARDEGARISAPEEFFARFGAGERPRAAKAQDDPVVVDEWAKYFEDERNRWRDDGD